jgi:hypothetical protein
MAAQWQNLEARSAFSLVSIEMDGDTVNVAACSVAHARREKRAKSPASPATPPFLLPVPRLTTHPPTCTDRRPARGFEF